MLTRNVQEHHRGRRTGQRSAGVALTAIEGGLYLFLVKRLIKSALTLIASPA